MRKLSYLVAALLVLGISGVIYAAPVGLTSEADATKAEWAYNDITLSAGFVADSLERKIDIDSGEFEMSAYVARLGINVIERFNLYVDLGVTQDMEYNVQIRGENIRYEFDDEFLWGIGANVLIYRWGSGIEIGVNAAYRQADMNLEKATFGTTIKTAAQLDTVQDGEYQDWHIAAEVAWRTDYLIPYLGIRYSDAEVDGYFIDDATTRDARGKNSAQNVGVFVGLTLTPKLADFPKSEQIALNLEGRFIDEDAFSVGLSYKF